MSNSRKKGLRIGKYRITPLGIGVLVALLAVGIAFAVLSLTGDKADRVTKSAVSVTATPTATAAVQTETTPTPTPTVKPTATPTAEPTATPEPAPRSATVRVLGEITMEEELLQSASTETEGNSFNPNPEEGSGFDFAPMFSEISDVIANADYTIADVEGTMGNTYNASADKNVYITPPTLLNALSEAGVDMLMMANDHVMDGGVDDLKATLEKITSAGMDYVGAGATAEEKTSPVVVDINGIKVGFAAYCEKMSKKMDDEAKTLVSMISGGNAAADVQSLKDAGAEVVVVLVNWGEMYSHTPNASQEKIAKFLNGVGVDVIVGFHPHAIQPVYWMENTAEDGTVLNRTLCISAPGSLLSNQTKAGTNCGAIIEFTLSEQDDGSIAVESPAYIPTYTLRTQFEDDRYDYRAVVISRYTAEGAVLAEGMTAENVEYMAKLQSAIQSVVGTDATMISE